MHASLPGPRVALTPLNSTSLRICTTLRSGLLPQWRAASSTASGSGRGGHVPGDCYVWGSTAVAAGGTAAGAAASPWQHSLSPVLVDDSTHLDVRSVGDFTDIIWRQAWKLLENITTVP